MAKILVAGGAGYIGSHVCEALAQAGHEPVVLDNLCNGHRAFVKWGPLVEADVRDAQAVRAAFAAHRPDAVIHFAALIEVGTSQTDTTNYYDNNVAGAINLARLAEEAGVRAFVFSSTCAVYGNPQRERMDETHPLAPMSPYGRTKLAVDTMLADLREFRRFPAISLRYFNAAGANWRSGIGEKHEPETHAIPLAIHAALGRRAGFRIFGTDYPTPDGTAVRDYVHVADLASAHVLAAEHLLAGKPGGVFNLGTGTGSSVRELVETIRAVSGRPFAVAEVERRPGDPALLVADNTLARTVLGWQPTRTLHDIVESAWRWHAETEAQVFGETAQRAAG